MKKLIAAVLTLCLTVAVFVPVPKDTNDTNDNNAVSTCAYFDEQTNN